ncbi:MAG TPA: hypothetical protein VHT91_10635 [Kofleriaceae bacterium]|nr:hypothetical protein [Kofleriaceae bacterium]
MKSLEVERIAAAIVTVVVALTAPAAASHKILVLPVEGAIDAALRNRLTAAIARLARSLDGQVASGSATFADTALAVGCDPRAAGCSDEVMATLGVDELVWGAASRDRGPIRLVVRRVARGAAVREVAMTLASGDADDRLTAEIAPLFAPPGAAPEPAPASQSSAPPPPAIAAAQAPPGPLAEPGPPLAAAGPGDDRRDRKLGIALAAGGGGSLVLGLALWAHFSGMQDSIDHHATRTPDDFRDLTALEDRASSYAIAGDVFVLAGLVAGGLGGYLLYRDHRRHLTIAPAPIAGGAMLAVMGGL